jgi:hypothetical protein
LHDALFAALQSSKIQRPLFFTPQADGPNINRNFRPEQSSSFGPKSGVHFICQIKKVALFFVTL